ncbi:MAG: beta-ketoacyl-[acyl-carrier-protein] synthase family protein [Planctomycetia bacterium]|nr:beta-ketoacyl-[acyl-carrier-protein] synthase family protein [Planctomycetia bacterium]
MRRVAITGLGVVAPNGVGRKDFWSACVNGRSGVKPIRSFDASSHPVRVAAEVPAEFDVTQYLPVDLRKNLKIMNRASCFAVGAAQLAIDDSGLELEKEDRERIGVVMGTGLVPMDLDELTPLLVRASNEEGQLQHTELGRTGNGALFPLWILKYLPNMVATHISLSLQLKGPNSTITTACVAGTQAVGEAARLIALGDADVILAGGADSRIDPLLMLAYLAMGALSKANRSACEVSRPFDRLRDGFVLGEGSGVLVLEDMERAKQRGAVIYAEVLGFGSSFDAYSVTKPDPQAGGAARAIAAALKQAQVDAHDVDYINAHGTSTRLNDQMETAAVKRVFGEQSRKLPMSSIKSMVGHLIGAAGAVEAVALALTLHQGVLPPTINLTHPDPDCNLDYVPNCAREVKVRTAVSTSFGFGGQNGALVMQRC